MVGNTDHLSPVDRASVLKIIEDWNNPVVIDLEGAKRIREVEASPGRQAGRTSEMRIIQTRERAEAYRAACQNSENAWFPQLTENQRAVFESDTPFIAPMRRQRIRLRESRPEVLSFAQLVSSYWKDIAPYRFEADRDPLAGTFVRGGWRRRRIYPQHHHMDALGYASEVLPNFLPVPGMFYPFQYP